MIDPSGESDGSTEEGGEIVVPSAPLEFGEDPELEERARKEYATLSHGVLSPRHRKLAELFASGASNAEVARELHYVQNRVSVLKHNSFIAAEIERIRQRIYEDTVAVRLKQMNDSALNVLEKTLTDNTNRVKHSEKIDVAKFVIEKTDGKAAQKLELGGSMLGSLLDKLDALKSAGRSIEDSAIDVTPRAALPPGKEEGAPAPIPDELKDWIEHF